MADVGGTDAATGAGNAPMGPIGRGTSGRSTIAPGTIGFDWLLTGLCGLIAVGGYLLIKGAREGTLDADALVSLPALLIHAGAIPAIILLGWAGTSARSSDSDAPASLPPAYQPALLGTALYVAGLVLTLFDIGSPLDVDSVAGLVSPGALLLGAGATLIASGPVLGFGSRSIRGKGARARPVTLGLSVAAAWLLAIPTLFVAVAHPWVTDAGLALSEEPPFELHTDLYAIPLTGAASLRLTATADEDEVHPAIHPDGSRIAVGRGPAVDSLDLWMLAIDGSDIAQVTDTPDAIEDGMTWSPDGTRLAWWSDLSDESTTPVAAGTLAPAPYAAADFPQAPRPETGAHVVDTWIADTAGAGAKRIPHPDTDEGVESWSPDGTRWCGWLIVDDQSEVHTYGVDGSDPVRVTDDPGEDWSCSWSPDGQQLVFHTARDGDYEIFTVAPDGTDERRLTDNESMDMLPRWSPDGEHIAFISDASGEIEVYVMDADGGGVRDVSQDPALDDGVYGIDWMPDGTAIVAASMGRPVTASVDASFRGAIGAIALAAVILGLAVGLVLRFGPRIGTFTIMLGLTGLLVGLLGDSIAAIAAFIIAGLATDAVGAWASASPGTARAGVTGAVAAGVLAGATFAAGSVEAGLAWDGERLVGAVLLAGLIGGACAGLACRPTGDRATGGPTVEGSAA